MLLNLLTNSVKYTEKGKIILKLTSKVQDKKAILCFSIKDTGIGIEQEIIDVEPIGDFRKRIKDENSLKINKADELDDNIEFTEEVEEKLVQDFQKTKIDIWEALYKRLPEINFQAGMNNCCNDKDFYLEIFNDFVNLNIKEELTGFLTQNDYKNYCIRIHGFKNNAYSIGAKKMGDLAFEMEKLTKESLSEEIKDMQEDLFEQFDRVCKQFNNVVMLVGISSN